ncbi:cell adhesion molecule DSCAML1-like isoform X3 [Acropora palmata]|uniref:cell adhesion molecule DSCAML1-like isoform X3 n=1 Tax=Acropora palmata TaxID=6131 RepID=UPI003DA0EE76
MSVWHVSFVGKEDSLPLFLSDIPWALHFTEEPTDTRFAHTRSAILNCRVEDRPKAQIKWQLARTGLSITQNITGVRLLLPNGSLYFPPFRQGSFDPSIHRADYQCIVTNRAGTIASRIAKLRAVVVEPYLVYAQDSYIIRGNNAVIKSMISEHALDYVQVISWHDGRKAIAFGGKYFLMPSGDLVITNVKDADKSSMFYCTTVNKLTGEKVFSNPAKLFLKDPPKSSPPRLLNDAFNLTVLEGDVSELQCTASGYPVPAVVEYSWKKDGKPLQMGNRFSRFAGGSLRIEQTTFQDQGLYECVVKNSRGSTAISVHLTVRVPLRFVVRPQRKITTVSQTSGFIMECKVSGQPRPNITWLHNGSPLTSTSGGRISFTSERLEYAVIYSKDLGVFQCLADNGLETVQSSAMLITAERNPTVSSSVQLVLKQGESLSVWCRAFSQSTPEITWYLDGEQVYNGAQYGVTNTQLSDGGMPGDKGTQSTLTASTMKVEKTGEYKCVACNIGNCTSQVIPVYIDGTANITSLANVINAVGGQAVQLPCTGKGYPLPLIAHWSKSGISIPFDKRHTVSEKNTLTIFRVQKGDEGTYRCRVVNAANKEDERFIEVVVNELPNINIHANQPEWHEGTEGSLTCSYSASSHGEVIIQWLKDGNELTSSIYPVSVLRMSVVILKNLSAADSGNYTCIASNNVGTTSVSINMVVFVPPKIIQEPVNQQVLKSYTSYLTCATSGTPPARVDWSKLSLGFKSVSMDQPRFEKMLNGTLVIRNTTDEDRGKYLCTARNGVSDKSVSRPVQLTVHAVPALIVIAPANKAANVSANVIITCVAMGNLPIELEWFNESTQMAENPRVKIKTSTESKSYRVNSTLTVERLVLEDTRQYSCRVKNTFGNDVRTFDIKAQQRPYPPSKPEVEVVTASSVYLTWRRRFDGNAAIIEYTVECKLTSQRWEQSTKRVVLGSAPGFNWTGLRPASKYNFRVYSRNALGTSEPSVFITTETREGAPSKPPNLVNVTAISSKEIYVRWEPPPPDSRNGVIRGYYITYKQSNKHYRRKNFTVNGGKTRSYVISNLHPFTEYQIEIQAFTRAGVSPVLRNAKAVVTHEDVPSQPPTSVSITVLSSQSLKITWNKPPSNAINGKLLGYRVYYHSIKDPENVFNITVNDPNERNVTLTSLAKFSTYKISVVAFTRKGEGVASPGRRGATLEDIPGPPSNVHAVPVSIKTIRVLWDPPIEPNGIIIAYRLFYSKAISDPLVTNADKVTEVSIAGNYTSKILAKLESITEYFFWVKASTSVGFGNASVVVRQTTMEKIKANIFHDNLPVTLARQSTSAILDCEAYGYPKPSVMWYSSGRDLSDARKYLQLTNGSLEIKHVTQKDAGEYECTASNRLGRKTVFRKLKVKTPPSPPKLIDFKKLDHTPALNISWRKWDDGNSPVTMFILEYKENNGNWKVQYISNINYYVLHGVDYTKDYYFRISALNSVGKGETSKVFHVVFGEKGYFIVKEVEEPKLGSTPERGIQLYRNPTFLGVVMGVGVLMLIVIICLLLIAVRAGYLNTSKFHDWRQYWKKRFFGEPLPTIRQEEYDQRQSNPDQSEGSPSTNGNLADSSSSLEPIRSTHGSEISLPRSTLRAHIIQEPIIEESYTPPLPPHHSSVPSGVQPVSHADGSFSDTSSEGNCGQSVYHRPTIHDTDSTARPRRYVDMNDHATYPNLYVAQRSLNGTPGNGVLGFRGHADGGSELDTASITRGQESATDLRRFAAASRLSRPSKSQGQSQEFAQPVCPEKTATLPRPRDSGLGPSRTDLHRPGFNSKRGSSQVTPEIRAIQTPQRRDSVLSKERSPCHTLERPHGLRDRRAYDSASSEYSSSRDELISALEFGKRHSLDKYYGIPTLETMSVSSNTTNSSEQDGICKFSASPRPLGDGCYAPTPLHGPSFRSRGGNGNFLYVVDPRRRGVDRGACIQKNGSVV